MAYSALVVDVDRKALEEASAALADAGYLVTRASTFAEGRQRLVLARPDVLITAVRLAGFNGLHLIVISRAARPELVAVLTHGVPDSALQTDAARNEAMFLVQPVDWPSCLNVIGGVLAERDTRKRTGRPRRWARKTPSDGIDAVLGVTLMTIVNVSYGGVRLRSETPIAEGLGKLQTLELPGAGLTVNARPLWIQGAGPDGPWWCGAEVQESGSAPDRAWRLLVDAVRPDSQVRAAQQSGIRN
ncbi:MAG TPA: hypothetical protein VKD69_25115 [Vicinamibacterales bacterium]|nr:hypothetical protein [Vicinamibacterales bacterium]